MAVRRSGRAGPPGGRRRAGRADTSSASCAALGFRGPPGRRRRRPSRRSSSSLLAFRGRGTPSACSAAASGVVGHGRTARRRRRDQRCRGPSSPPLSWSWSLAAVLGGRRRRPRGGSGCPRPRCCAPSSSPRAAGRAGVVASGHAPPRLTALGRRGRPRSGWPPAGPRARPRARKPSAPASPTCATATRSATRRRAGRRRRGGRDPRRPRATRRPQQIKADLRTFRRLVDDVRNIDISDPAGRRGARAGAGHTDVIQSGQSLAAFARERVRLRRRVPDRA